MKKIPLSYYHSLPKKRMGSGVIIRNKKSQILILKTTYKEHWEIPGGVVEKDESPRETAIREVLEEIGLKINIRRCLVIHYRKFKKGQDENIMFVFDGGMLSTTNTIKLNKSEIIEARFVSFNKASEFVGERIASRLPFCKKSLKTKRTIYLESIKEITPVEI